MLLSEAIETLEKAGYEVEPLNEGKIGRALGALAIGLSTLTHASTPVSIDELNSDRYTKLSDEEIPEELESEKGYGDFYYDTKANEYVLYDENNNEAIGYDSTFSIETIATYEDSTGKLKSERFNDSSVVYTNIPDTLKAAIDSINQVLDMNLTYKDGYIERGKPVTMYIVSKDDNRIRYIENGRFKYAIQMPKEDDDAFTFVRFDKNEVVNLAVTFYTDYNFNLKGNEMAQIRVVEDLLKKSHIEYYTNGRLKVEGKLDNKGERHGIYTSYYPSGKKAGTSQYSHGKQIGYTKCVDGRIGNKNLQCQIDDED